MAEMNIFQRGDKAKFIITSQNPNLNMETCDFYVELIYGMRSDKLTIQKEDMLYGTDGEYVMIFDTSKMIGKIKARFVWYCIDTDVDPDNRRQEVDEQYIGFVVDTPCPQFFTCPKCSNVGRDVRYELTDEPDIAAKYLRLCVTETVTPEHGEPYPIYRPLVTRNDEYLYVLRESADALAEALNNANSNN
jgi:hypothetical protein